jgi:hypothetical protein
MSEAAPSSADLRVGDSVEPLRFTVTPELNERFLFAVEDYNLRYYSSGRGEGC